MVRIAAHGETTFRNLPVSQRMARIAQAGFDAVEFWFFGGMDVREVASACATHGITVSDFVLNSPDGSRGGSLVNPADRRAYLDALGKAVETARILSCTKLITCTGNEISGVPRDAQKKAVVDTLSEAALIAERQGITLLLEPLNTKVDHPGYFLASSAEGFDIVRAVNSPSLRLLYDCYHMQIMEGNLCATIIENLPLIGHFHAAGVPGRRELFCGEVNYPYLLRRIEEAGYDGFFGLEYTPSLPDEESLRTVREYLARRPDSDPCVRRQSG